MCGNKKSKKYIRIFCDNALNLVLVSAVTGLCAGILITFYCVLANIGENVSESLYLLIMDNPAFIPLLLAGLALCGILIGTFVRLVPMIRGSGIPQIEGAARGIVRFKWYVAICSMFAASLACIFLGLSAGSEGPSVEMGGCVGEANGRLLKRNYMTRRLQIASGSSAGLAVAFNAPVTGLVFAMEEAFRSFSPKVFISSAIAVVTALFTRNAIRPLLGYGTGFTFDTFVFSGNFSFIFCLWAVFGALAVSLAGVGFYYSVIALKKVFKKITFLNNAGRYIIPFVLAGAFGLITVYAIGGGHSFIEQLGSGSEGALKNVFGAPFLASLAVIVVIRFIAAILNMSCEVPCGVFIPMLAIGAGLGAFLSYLFGKMGMSAEYSDYLIIICMSVFFTTVVKAPVTGLVMIFELTGQFTNLLPALASIAVGYLVGMLFKTEPIYERSLAGFIKEEGLLENAKKIKAEAVVQKSSVLDGNRIRNVIWPTNGLVVNIIRADGSQIVPDGETEMYAGDTVIFECETSSSEELYGYMYELAGKPSQDDGRDK